MPEREPTHLAELKLLLLTDLNPGRNFRKVMTLDKTEQETHVLLEVGWNMYMRCHDQSVSLYLLHYFSKMAETGS
jgi:hypothetical protein